MKIKYCIILLLVNFMLPNFSQSTQGPEMENIFPYLITNDYPINVNSGKSVCIGNDIYYEYVIEKNQLLESIDITKQKNVLIIQLKAIENLKKAFKNDIKAMSFENGPGNKSFILIGNHWSAATQILNPDLFSWACKILHSEILLISIPNRETLLIFPSMDSIFYKDIEKMVKDKESNTKKMLTFKLFELSKNGLKPLQ